MRMGHLLHIAEMQHWGVPGSQKLDTLEIDQGWQSEQLGVPPLTQQVHISLQVMMTPSSCMRLFWWLKT